MKKPGHCTTASQPIDRPNDCRASMQKKRQCFLSFPFYHCFDNAISLLSDTTESKLTHKNSLWHNHRYYDESLRSRKNLRSWHFCLWFELMELGLHFLPTFNIVRKTTTISHLSSALSFCVSDVYPSVVYPCSGSSRRKK